MYYIPKKKPKAAGVLSVSLYGAATALYVLGEFISPRLMYQFAALVFAAAGIFFTSRYLLSEYKYVITDIERAGQEASFSIIKISGKRENAVANFDILSIYAMEKCRRNAEFEQKHGKVDKIYNYTSNLFSNDVYKLAIEFNGKKVLFSLEFSDEFAHELSIRLPMHVNDAEITGKGKNDNA